MYGQMIDALPPITQIDAIENPVERAQLLSRLAREHGTLPSPYAARRRTAFIEALDGGSRKVCWLAKLLGLTPSRVSQVVRATT